MPDKREVTDADMPQLFQAADAASLNAQAAFVNGTRLRLGLVVVVAGLGVTSWRVGPSNIDVLAVASTFLFAGALLMEGALWRSRPDKTWYDARAIAESVKTLAWKYAVRGEPFNDEAMSERDATRSLLERLGGISAQYPHVELAAVDAAAVSVWMTEQRKEPWTERKEVYRVERLLQQKTWYHAKANYNKKRSTQWRMVLVVTEFLGIVASILSALSESMPLFSPLFAALVVAVVAWLEAKKHDFNARAYAAAVSDLAQAEIRLKIAEDEAAWAQEVENAEEAISREHTLWLASRNEP